MKCKPSTKRIKELEEIYKALGLDQEEFRKYLVALGSTTPITDEAKVAVFLEAGTTSLSKEKFEDAGLE